VTIRRVSSRTVYENRWLRLREDAIERSDGTSGVYAVIDKREAAVVIPWDGERLHLVGQYRYTVGRHAWEFPQGAIDEGPVLEPEAVAAAELVQETGLRAGALRHLGHLYFAYGMSSQGYDAWLATDLAGGEPQPDAEEHDLQVRRVTVRDFEAMVRAEEIVDSATLACWSLLGAHGVQL
jgi:8-oxo-dGTP pyrophosphatase MutT (NUDIX family)